MISFCQKHGIERTTTPEIDELLKESQKGIKTLSAWAAKPPPEEFYAHAAEALSPYVDKLTEPAVLAEVRWVGAILKAACAGEIETTRQRGMYVDVGSDGVVSDPGSVSFEEAGRWIEVAKRILLILEDGDFRSTYGPG